MSLKSTKRTTERIIAMVESGDYDPAIIEHMVESVVKGRDRRIKKLETTSKDRVLVLDTKRISGALKSTIKEHGPITKNNISSAAKRIFGSLMQIITEPNQVVHQLGKISVTYDKNTTHRLTVAADGSVRIKVAKDTSEKDTKFIVDALTGVAKKAIKLDVGTLRGKVNKESIYKNNITLYTDSKKNSYIYVY